MLLRLTHSLLRLSVRVRVRARYFELVGSVACRGPAWTRGLWRFVGQVAEPCRLSLWQWPLAADCSSILLLCSWCFVLRVPPTIRV